jgi:hypothetical protein
MPLFVHHNLFQYGKGSSKSKYCIIWHFCSETSWVPSEGGTVSRVTVLEFGCILAGTDTILWKFSWDLTFKRHILKT